VDREAVVHRLLERYLVEIVELYDLCPWARGARLGGELAVAVLWGSPNADDFAAAGRDLLARAEVRVAMIVAPQLDVTPAGLHQLRDLVTKLVPSAGVADFHPASPLDLASPARLVPYLRRSPDPLLQLVPLEILDAARARSPAPDLAHQAQILGGHAAPPRGDVATRIAAANHQRVGDASELARRLSDIAADRAASYARVGITVPSWAV
jgi:hypothetical protein